MTSSVHHTDDWLTIHGGDARDVLPELPTASVHCVVTSPPYWGLRDYGTATWIGGEYEHAHVGVDLRTADVGGPKQQTKRGSIGVRSGDCACGATRQDAQLGLEATPEEYVANLVAVFRELRRVLRDDGTVWLNLGDSYASSGAQGPNSGLAELADRYAPRIHPRNPNRDDLGEVPRAAKTVPSGLKPKDLVGIPWRVAFALQADGWWLRSDIIWSKPNPMPESVTDRPTKAHEYLFLLAKRERYYFDQEAVREAANFPDAKGIPFGGVKHVGNNGNPTYSGNLYEANGGRNLRSVWTIATRPYPGAHFAVFPPELPERCIKAGSSERGVCPECGAPWQRVVERTIESTWQERKAAGAQPGWDAQNGLHNGARHQVPSKGSGVSGTFLGPGNVTAGWERTCAHDREPVGAVVLDPFAGSGTVGLVANRLSRRAILIDLNPEYLAQQMKRNAQIPVGL